MEAWRKELYHHGILGQKWGRQMGPPYPLAASSHSSAEKKAGWKKSLDKNGNKSDTEIQGAGGGGGVVEEEEYKDLLEDLYKALEEAEKRFEKFGKDFDPVDYLNSQDFGLTLGEELGIDSDKYSAKELDTIRRLAMKHYTKDSDPVTKASKTAKGELDYQLNNAWLKAEQNKEDNEALNKVYADLDKLDKDGNQIVRSVISERGKNKDGSKYDEFESALIDAGVDTDKMSSEDIERLRKKAEKHYSTKDQTEESESRMLKKLYSELDEVEDRGDVIVENIVNSKGKNDDGSSYDDFKAALGEAGIDVDKLSSAEVESMRKKAETHYTEQAEEAKRRNSQLTNSVTSKRTKIDPSKIEKSLKHHGIQGQRWGVRRFQPYPKGSPKRGKEVGEASELKMKRAKKMSDADLDVAIERLRKEKEYKELRAEARSNGKSYATKMLLRLGDKAVTSLVDNLGTKTGQAVVAAAMKANVDPEVFKAIYPKK